MKLKAEFGLNDATALILAAGRHLETGRLQPRVRAQIRRIFTSQRSISNDE